MNKQKGNKMKRRLSPAEQQRKRHHEEWKESLRRACFDRARKNRKDVIWNKRRQQQQQQQQGVVVEQTFDNHSNINNPTTDDVRSVVEHELRQQGVAIVTPGGCVYRKDRVAKEEHCPGGSPSPLSLFYPGNSNGTMASQSESARQQQFPSPSETPYYSGGWHFQQEQQEYQSAGDGDDTRKLIGRQESYDSERTEYVISEEELYDLLQEVEEEMRHSEEELLEEVLEQERLEQEEIEHQIAQYEEWEDSLAAAAAAASNNSKLLLEEEGCVVCPICCESMLQMSSQSSPTGKDDNNNNSTRRATTVIICPNESIQIAQNISLAELKERLRLGYESHSMCCRGTLTFELQPTTDIIINTMDPCENRVNLVGSCSQCNQSSIIA